MGREQKPIDWQYWTGFREVELWQAVLLSLGLDPDQMEHSKDSWMFGSSGGAPFLKDIGFPDRASIEGYRKRLALLSNNRSDRNSFTAGTIRMGSPNRNGVKLGEVSAWLIGKNMSVPTELAEISQSPSSNRPQLESRVDLPLNVRERASLLLIIAALCNHSKLDFKKRSKTAGIILRELQQIGCEIGESTIEGHLKKIPDLVERRTK